MRILVSAITRFHLFRLAQTFVRAGCLAGLHTSYPRYVINKRYSEFLDYCICRPQFALALKTILKTQAHLNEKIVMKIYQIIHSRFSSSLVSINAKPIDMIWSMSSFSSLHIKHFQSEGVKCVVDHGSLHEKTELDILTSEFNNYGFRPFGNTLNPWIINLQQSEFMDANLVVCCSQLAKISLINNGVPSDKILVNQLGVDLDGFSPSLFRNDSDIFRFIYVGNMNPRKGVHYLLQAWKLFDDHKAELLLVGSPTIDPVFHNYMSDFMKDDSRIRFIGSVSESDLVRYYNESDVFILPSLADGWGMVVLQAMSCGLPVIVSSMTGAKEAVDHGYSGTIIKPGCAESILEALMFYRSLPKVTIREMGMNARERVSAGYKWEDYGLRAMSIIDQFDI